MKIFKFESRKDFHILDETSNHQYSYCRNASWDDGYRSRKDGDIIKGYEGERICKGCIGGAYDANVINIVHDNADTYKGGKRK